MKLLGDAAAAGYPPAIAQLGWVKATGDGLPKDVASGMALVRKALATDDPEAHLVYGLVLAQGIEGGEHNWQEAIEHLTVAADHGVLRAWAPMWSCYEKQGAGGEKFDLLRKGADLGDATAQWMLFTCYSIGQYVARDLKEAQRWGILAAQSGVPAYQRALGEFYLKAKTEAGDTAAIRCLEPANAGGDMQARYLLGQVLLDNATTPTGDPARGVRLIREAAEAGVPDAEVALAHQLMMGLFVKYDPQEARSWLERATQDGSPEARKMLRWIDYTEKLRSE